MLLARLAVALKGYPLAEWFARADSAHDDPNRSALLVGLGRLEHQSFPLRQVRRDFVETVSAFGNLCILKRHRASTVVPRFHLLSLLDPRRLFLQKGSHRPLRDTKSRQRSMVNSLRCRGCEPLRSASRRLGFTIEICPGPRGRGPASPFCRLRSPRDPHHTWPAPLLRGVGVVFVAVLVVSQQDDDGCRFRTVGDPAFQGTTMTPSHPWPSCSTLRWALQAGRRVLCSPMAPKNWGNRIRRMVACRGESRVRTSVAAPHEESGRCPSDLIEAPSLNDVELWK
ncbi:hypothetical protein H4582DRAFT_1204118 [Lactarius indigo]|nr:hypothetical protein H4582DRAFT_1204118 [Lactarius indigo]